MALPAALTSCSEEAEFAAIDTEQVAFVADMPGLTTRTNYDVADSLFSKGFTVSAFCPDTVPGADGILPVHCENVIVTRQADGTFRSGGCRWPHNRGENTGYLKFFAFHPSIDDMRREAEVGEECFIYSNNTVMGASGPVYDYRLTRFHVAPDISRQVDFVIATGEGNKTEHLYSGIQVGFEHQLSGVEIAAWGASSLYDIEIAGVRVGGIVMEADMKLSAVSEKTAKNENTLGEWIIPGSPAPGHADYVFAVGDTVVRINTGEHNTKATAASIMGTGGKAMLIPGKYDKWDHKTPNAKGMYFSALVRISKHGDDALRVYPSTDPESQDYLVYLAVSKADGTVKARLDKHGNLFGTTTKYVIPATEELREYGWAAVPAHAEWKPGYYYSYVMDYTKGVGIHDPADPSPEIVIIDWGGVEVTATSGQWGGGNPITINEGGWGANTNDTAPDGTVWWK